MSAPMIEVRGLHSTRGAQPILRGVDLEVRRGEVAVLMGPSGSGKSTLLRCLNGLQPFDEGALRVGELTVPPRVDARRDAALLGALRKKLGFVFQELHLFPHLDVIGNVIEAQVHVLGRPKKDAIARGAALLERMGLGRKLSARIGELSGGQRQRVAIARALAMDPEAVLFDEPTSALDPRTTLEVAELLSELARDGNTLVVVTHDPALARAIAGRIHVLADGVRVEHGDRAVLDAPTHPATRSLLGAR
jgi:ABC-type polar amino acid transport system ATPase subunit